jgi:hypothetical protein
MGSILVGIEAQREAISGRTNESAIFCMHRTLPAVVSPGARLRPAGKPKGGCPLSAANLTSRLEDELQSELNQARRLGLKNLVKGGRTDVGVGQAKIRMVQQIEKLGTELKLFALGHGNILE